MGGIAVLSNPRSGVNRRNPALVQKLAYMLGDTGELRQPPDLDHLEDTVRELRERQVEVICVNGGDGTLHKSLSAIVRVYADGATGEALRQARLPKIAILKSGTVNTISRNIGLKTKAEEMLGRVVAAHHGGPPLRTVERSCIVVNGQHAGFIFGIGVLARFMQLYYEGGTTGAVKALRVLTRVVLSGLFGTQLAKDLFQHEAWRVTADGRSWTAPGYAAMAIGTIRDIGLGFELWCRALDDPERMHALGFACGPQTVLKVLPNIYLGRPFQADGILEALPHRVVIEHGAPVHLMMDGDFIPGVQRLEVECGPRVRFLVP
jgi:diacylglycerol kinase family enzyme